jgi:predicted transcriptional regulator
MSAPLATFKTKEKVETVYEMLKDETFCGFPVIEDDSLVSIIKFKFISSSPELKAPK